MVTTRSSRSSRSVEPRGRGPADRPHPRLGQPLRTPVAQVAHRRLHPRPLDGVGGRHRRPRGGDRGRLPDVPRSRCSRRSGSGCSRETHAVSGQPVARRARMVVARRTASTTIGTPGGLGQRVDQVAPGPWARARAARRRRSCSASRAAAAETSPVEPGARATPCRATRLLIAVRSSSMPSPVVADVASTGTPAEPVGLQQSAYVVEHASIAGRSGISSMWLSDDQHHVAVRGHRRAGTGRGWPRRRTSAGRAPRPSGRSARPAGRPRGGGSPRWSRGRAGRAAPARRDAVSC